MSPVTAYVRPKNADDEAAERILALTKGKPIRRLKPEDFLNPKWNIWPQPVSLKKRHTMLE